MAIKKKQLKKIAEKAATTTLGGVAKSATKKNTVRKVAKSATTGATIGGALANKVAKPKSSVSISKQSSLKGPIKAQNEGRAYTAANPAPKPKAGTKYFDTTTGKTGTVYNAPTEQLRKAKKMMNSLN